MSDHSQLPVAVDIQPGEDIAAFLQGVADANYLDFPVLTAYGLPRSGVLIRGWRSDGPGPGAGMPANPQRAPAAALTRSPQGSTWSSSAPTARTSWSIGSTPPHHGSQPESAMFTER